jgi:beta-lactamase class A
MTGAGRVGAAVLSAAVLLVGCTTGTTGSAPHSSWSAVGSSPATDNPTSPAVGTPVAATSTPTPAPPSPRELARQTLAKMSRGLPAGAISLAVRDERTGATFAFGAHGGMWTASVYKVLVLETLLLERQDSGSWFSSGELDEITRMIEQSDNVAGYDLFLDAGGNTALATAAQRLGLRHTVIGRSDPTFTTMSARDGLALLDCLVHRGPLTPRSQLFMLNLMRSVETDQRWGVGVLADPGTTFANKNGWLGIDNANGPGEDDNGLWVTNSLGIVRVHGHQLLVAVLTRHNPDLDTGIRLVERLARIAAPAVLPAN